MTATPAGHTGRCLSRRTAIGGAACLGIGTPLLAACGSDDSNAGSGSDGEEEAEAPAAGTAIAATGDIPVGGGVIFGDDGVVITQPTEGEFLAFGATCTHQGCTVTGVTETIDCSCHGSSFSLEDGSPTAGPAADPLPAVEITVEGDEITVV